MNVPITGGSGYFGSLLVNRIAFKKLNCRVFDLNAYNGSKSVGVSRR